MSSSSADQTVTADSQHIAMETYWQELESMGEEQEEEEEEQEEDEEEERQSIDELQLEEAWLTEAGLSTLLVGSSSEEASPAAQAPPPAQALLATLTHRQTHTVETRLHNYTRTLKGTRRQAVTHVKDVFALRPPESQLPIGCYDKKTTKQSKSAHPGLSSFCSDVEPSCPPAFSARADGLLRDWPYSDGVAEHRGGGTCRDCLPDRAGDVPLVCPWQGATQADDLSSDDMKRLGFVCHIELSTFLLALGVESKRRRPRRTRSGDGAVFGVPLDALLDDDRKKCPGLKVPVVFHKSGLQTEGFLRVSGLVARLKSLRSELDRCPEGFDWSALRQVDAAGLLKLFIGELPTPLLTHAYRAVLAVSGSAHQVQALHLLTLMLPEANRGTLRALLAFLRRVVSHQERNKMSLWNVSTVMAPNLLAPRRRDGPEEALGGAHLLRLMITHQDLLWTIPNFLLSQLRQMNQACDHKLGLLLRARNDKNQKQVTELCEGVIKVHAPLHAKASMAVQLDRRMTAKDVTAHFSCDNSGAQRLFEVGGNIGERRLHPDCLLSAVYHANRGCRWLVKP